MQIEKKHGKCDHAWLKPACRTNERASPHMFFLKWGNVIKQNGTGYIYLFSTFFFYIRLKSDKIKTFDNLKHIRRLKHGI